MIYIAEPLRLDKAHKKHIEQVLRTMKKALTQICLAAAIPLSAGAAMTSPNSPLKDIPLSSPTPLDLNPLKNSDAVATITADKVTLSPSALKLTFSLEANVSTATLTMFGQNVRLRMNCEDAIARSADLKTADKREAVRERMGETAAAIFLKISDAIPLTILKEGEVDRENDELRFVTEVIMQTVNLHETAIHNIGAACKVASP